MFKDTKIAFFDMDGTLFDHSSHAVSKNVREALKQLKANGVILVVATGRPHEMLHQVQDVIDEVGFDYLVTSNGQSIYHGDKLVYRNFLDKEDVKTIIKIANDKNLTLALVGDNINIANRINDRLERSCESVGFACPKQVPFDETFDKNLDHAVCYEDIKYKKYFEGHLKKSVVTFWSTAVFEFTPDNGVKVHGIKKVLEHLKIPKEQAIAFGDGSNDIEMLEYVGFGVAMGNAPQFVKERADYVTDDIREDGVVNALRKIKLI